ncbi:MAG: 3-dehydroquinate synthase, partial [Bacteroidetes bacterium]|nr:3-dehydroquinate synthase [Bacteroidota bacterium]
RKNILGSFYQPNLVVVDIDFLFSLPKKELTSGLGEIIKYSYLWKDDFFNYLNNNYSKVYKFNKTVFQKLIYNSLLIKSTVVVKDEKEESLRKILNLGHTFAHAFESNSNFRVKHGEAVIAGLVASFYLSNQLGILKNEDLKIYISLPSAIKIEPFLKSVENKTILKIMGTDKKNKDGQIRFVLLKNIGEILLDVNATSSQIYSALNKTKKLFN